MGKLASITEKYQNDKIDDLRPSQLEDLQAELKGINEKDITSLSDAKTFLDLLGSFRKTIARVNKLNGEEYVKLISSILSVGEDGVYSDPNRFLYELIQNVDDCDYNDLSECKLNITFDIAADLLILEYNEKGFEPFNVYAITGIAERAKNVDKFKKEIGEKGIGFKSVFGVADKVLIQSGLFSFEINKENFTIPIPVYDNYKRTEGTKLTIYLPEGKAENLYRDFVERYCKDDAIFNKNPLLFLNKLTELNFYVDGFRYMKFKVTRPSLSGNFVIGDALLSVELRDPKINNGEIIDNTINCVWFSKSVFYDDYACQSRYGKDTALSEKQLTIAIVVPKAEDIKKVSGGTLYSYLPTQIKLKIPAAIHVPFKLDASREFVDPQGNNSSWFCSSYIGLSGLLKESYKRLAETVKEQIVYYLSKSAGSIFDGDNEKVNCLKCLGDFKREKLLALPIFYVNKEKYVSSSEIVCISDKECKEPQRVYSILNLKKQLFIPPEDSEPKRIGLDVIDNINYRVLCAALKNADVTKEALDYLCSLGEFPFNVEDIDREYVLKISQVIEIVQHKKVYKLFKNNALDAIEKNGRPKYSVEMPKLADIRQALGFTEDDVPPKVRKYLTRCNYKYVPVDSEKSFFFVAYNAMVLSKKGAINVFSDFVLNIDPDSGFAINQKLKKFSAELNNLEEDNSVTDVYYLQKLTENRKSVKSVLGKEAYKNYVNIVNNSGNDNLRFINELLQNADDCDYSEGVEPEFLLTYSDNHMTTDCNETGFTRADVRAITAIGDSTKTKLLRKEHNPTGEKGIGFKTVFSVAKDVTIRSRGFFFRLTAEEPTIPVTDKNKNGMAKDGTSMLFSLKQSLPSNLFDKEKVLKLCLCLRKLKKITLGKYVVEIEDDGEVKKVTINGEQHIFSKHIHCFKVTDALAIEEREKNDKKVNNTQYIYCYYGGKADKKEGVLYNVLPTQIKLNIPLYIDAPFMLTTSRDHVLNNNSWNNVILNNVYEAIKKVISAKKEELRSGVLELIGIGSKNENGKPAYFNNIFTDSNLNLSRWLYDICSVKFLPTFDKSVFVAPCDSKCRRYPAPANYILRKGENFSVPSSDIIDVRADEYDAIFNALHVEFEKPEKVVSEMLPFMHKYMKDKEYVRRLYPYLLKESKSIPIYLKHQLPIIPVYGNGEQGDYICWQKDKIFVKDDEDGLTEDYNGDYYLLNESILSQSDCKSILGVNIDRMNLAYIQKKYRDEFTEKCNCLFGKDLYEYILKEHKTGNLARFDCMDKVGKKEREDNLPLKNVNGEIVSCRLFINEKSDYIRGGIFDRLSVHSECLDLAKEAGCESLFNIHYGFIASCLKQDLTADDIETLKDDKLFVNGRELLFRFVSDGYVSEELIQKYNLEYCQSDYDKESSAKGEIPNNPVKDIVRLSARIREVWEDPRKIVDVQEIRYVKKIEYKGKKSDINYNDLRYDIIERYRPENNSKKCVCQMCKAVKDSKFIEVNNIESEPEYYWEQMRIALCLDCSKLFEEMRSDVSLMRIFKENILAADSQSDEPVYVSIDNYLYGITFTQTHLAEIQEILKLQDSDK